MSESDAINGGESEEYAIRVTDVEKEKKLEAPVGNSKGKKKHKQSLKFDSSLEGLPMFAGHSPVPKQLNPFDQFLYYPFTSRPGPIDKKQELIDKIMPPLPMSSPGSPVPLLPPFINPKSACGAYLETKKDLFGHEDGQSEKSIQEVIDDFKLIKAENPLEQPFSPFMPFEPPPKEPFDTSNDIQFMIDEIEWQALQSRYGEFKVVDALYEEYIKRANRIMKAHHDEGMNKYGKCLKLIAQAMHAHAKYSSRAKREALKAIRTKKPIVPEEPVSDDEETKELKRTMIQLEYKYFKNKKFKGVFPDQDNLEKFIAQSFEDSLKLMVTQAREECLKKTAKELQAAKDKELNLELLKQLQKVKEDNPNAKDVTIETNPITKEKEIVVKN